MRLIKKGSKKTRTAPLKVSSSPIAVIKRAGIRLVFLGIIYIASLWLLAPLVVYVLVLAKTNPASLSTALPIYLDQYFFSGWMLFEGQPIADVPKLIVVGIFTAAFAFGVIYIVFQQWTSNTIKNIFGPAASKTNEKGSARLFTNELLLSDLFQTWNGDWNNPPKKPGIVMGYSPTFGYYLSPPESHTGTFGLPGTGKTTGMMYETIDVMAASGCSLIITDPKGELYDATGQALRGKLGDSHVHILDFRNPERSECINMLSRVTDVFFEYYNQYLESSALARSILDENGKEDIEQAQYPDYWQDIQAYNAYMDAMRRAENFHKTAWAKAEEAALDLAAAVIPERPDAGAAKHWEDVARLLLKAFVLFVATYIEDDYVGDDGKPYTTPLAEQRTLEVVHYLLRQYGGISNKRKVFEEILSKIDPSHPAHAAFAQAKNSRDEDYNTAVAETIKFLDAILGMSVNSVLNRNDFDLATVGVEQTIIFVVLPDDRPAVGKLFSIFITQLYQALIAEATKIGKKLPVPVHFLLEEFGNIKTPIPDFASKLAMSRGYNIFFHIVLQGMNQLPPLYGEVTQKDILEKLSVRSLLQTQDAEGCGRYFSKNMGTYTYTTKRISRSRKAMGLIDDSQSASDSEGERDLMTPDEVTRWNPKWGTICLVSKPGKNPGFISSLFGYQTMMPCVFPSAPAWETPTAGNLDIGDELQMQQKAARAEAESRLDSRTPNAIWDPISANATSRMDLQQQLRRGGVSARQKRDFEKYSVRKRISAYVDEFIANNLDETELFDGRDVFIDNFVDRAIEALKEEQKQARVERRDEPDFDEAKQIRLDQVGVSAARGLFYQRLTDALLKAEDKSSSRPQVLSKPLPEQPKQSVSKRQKDKNKDSANSQIKKELKSGHDRSWMDVMRTELGTVKNEAHSMTEFMTAASSRGISVELQNGNFVYRYKGNVCGAKKLGTQWCIDSLDGYFAIKEKRSRKKENQSSHTNQQKQNSPKVAKLRRALRGSYKLDALESLMESSAITYEHLFELEPELVTANEKGQMRVDMNKLKILFANNGINLAQVKK